MGGRTLPRKSGLITVIAALEIVLVVFFVLLQLASGITSHRKFDFTLNISRIVSGATLKTSH